MSLDNTKFRDNLTALIASHGYTLAELSKHTGITSASLSRYTKTDRFPDLVQVVKIAQHFNVSIHWLLGLDEPGYNTLTAEALEIADLFQKATASDRRIVYAVLDPYKKG